MHARVSFYDMGSGSKEDAVRAFEGARGAIDQMEGSQGGLLLISSEGDKAITITLWETEDALRATASQADQTRQQAAGAAGMTIRAVEAYEVAMEFGTQRTAT